MSNKSKIVDLAKEIIKEVVVIAPILVLMSAILLFVVIPIDSADMETYEVQDYSPVAKSEYTFQDKQILENAKLEEKYIIDKDYIENVTSDQEYSPGKYDPFHPAVVDVYGNMQ